MEELSSSQGLLRRAEALDRLRAIAARWPWVTDLPRQLAICGAGWAAYILTFALLERLYPSGLKQQVGVDNARHVIDFERLLHLFNEQRIQQFANSHAPVERLLTGVYLWAHLPLIIVLAVWLYSWHRPTYNLVRNAFLISGGLALLCELAPVAPPHLVPGLDLTNTAASHMYDVVEPKAFFDPYGAVPSIHVSWSLIMGIAVWRNTRARWLHCLAVALPVLMTIAIVSTGNHYWFDAATGVIVGLAGLWLGAMIPGWRAVQRPPTLSFQPEPSTYSRKRGARLDL